jgi:transcriptional regulator with XRE-family HTH domain
MISPYVRKLRLADELRTLRTEAGVTHEQLAKMIGESRAQISRLENGHVVDQADIMKILDALEVDGDRWTQVITIAREAGERGWWESTRAMGERQARYADLEAGARTIQEFQTTFLPGLLQTKEYAEARALAERDAGAAGYTASDAVEAREGRQRMLRRPSGPQYTVIVDEVAVRRPAADREVVSAQLYHLAAVMNGSDTITVRVLPLDAVVRGYVLPRSAFAIYTFEDPGDPTVVMVDTVTADQVVTEPDNVKRYTDMFERLLEVCMEEGKGLDFLVRQAQEHLGHH